MTAFPVYRFQREPSPKRFIATAGERTVEREVLEGESLTEALKELQREMGEHDRDLLETAFRAGYLVGAWDAKNNRMWPSTA